MLTKLGQDVMEKLAVSRWKEELPGLDEDTMKKLQQVGAMESIEKETAGIHEGNHNIIKQNGYTVEVVRPNQGRKFTELHDMGGYTTDPERKKVSIILPQDNSRLRHLPKSTQEFIHALSVRHEAIETSASLHNLAPRSRALYIPRDGIPTTNMCKTVGQLMRDTPRVLKQLSQEVRDAPVAGAHLSTKVLPMEAKVLNRSPWSRKTDLDGDNTVLTCRRYTGEGEVLTQALVSQRVNEDIYSTKGLQNKDYSRLINDQVPSSEYEWIDVHGNPAKLSLLKP